MSRLIRPQFFYRLFCFSQSDVVNFTINANRFNALSSLNQLLDVGHPRLARCGQNMGTPKRCIAARRENEGRDSDCDQADCNP